MVFTARRAQLEFFEWLDREERHIDTYRDYASISLGKTEGWITTGPGNMDNPMLVRVFLTEKAKAELAKWERPATPANSRALETSHG